MTGWASSRADDPGYRPLTRATRAAILARDSGICHACGRDGADQIDHVVPVAEGGTDDPDNLAAIHATPCHTAKTAREAARNRPRRTRPPEAHPGLLPPKQDPA